MYTTYHTSSHRHAQFPRAIRMSYSAPIPIKKDMEGTKKETVVHTYDFGEDPIPPDHCCCGKMHIQKGCRIVAILCLLAVIANCVFYCLGFSKLGLSGYLEVGVLFFEFLSIFCLLCGLAKRRSGLLKPFLFFNTIWAIGLCILFLMCFWQIVKGGSFSQNLLRNIRYFKQSSEVERFRLRHAREEYGALASVITALAMFALLIIIAVDMFFIHVVYRAFHYFAYKEDKSKEDERSRTSIQA